MDLVEKILAGNAQWAEESLKSNPEVFQKLAQGQSPEIFWIGCSDSRILASRITNTGLGQLFVHRNVGNLCIPEDKNFRAALEFSVLVLKVKMIVICGHYGCGAMNAAVQGGAPKHVKEWIKGTSELYDQNKDALATYNTDSDKADSLAELNVIQQMDNIMQTDTYKQAEEQGHAPVIKGFVYSLETGKLKLLS